MHTPSHTPACIFHVIGDTFFIGDTLFMLDGGSARADFPGGEAGELFGSIARVLALPEGMRLFVCLDYRSDGRAIESETTIRAQKTTNIHLDGGATGEDFEAMRETRDVILNIPKLIIPSLQVNMRVGEVPKR